MEQLAIYPIALPLVLAAFFVCTSKIVPRMVADIGAILASLFVTGCSCFLLRASAAGTLVYWLGGWRPSHGAAIGIALVIDPMAAGLATLIGFLVTTAFIFAWRFFDSVGALFHALMLIFLAAMIGFAFSGDIFTLFVFFELMSVTAFALTAHKIEAQSIEGALNFAITNTIAAFLALAGIALLYGRTGALNLAQIGRTLATTPNDGLVVAAFTLITCAFLIKAAVVPFHFWLADAHAVAPTPVCVLFSGVMVELGVYGVCRVYWTVFAPSLGPNENELRLIFLALGGATVLVGALMCFWQRHIKRLLAFSTISHIGMILAGAGTLTARGTSGAALYVIGHGLVKASLFMSAGIFLQCFGTLDELQLHGRARQFKPLALIMAIAGFGLAGFPPYGTYLGKSLMEEATARFGQHWVTWVFTFASALTGAAVLRVAGSTFFGWGHVARDEQQSPTAPEKRETERGGRKLPVVMFVMAALLAILPAASGLIPQVANAVEAGAERFVDSAAYAHAVLDGVQTGPVRTTETAEPKAKGVVVGFGAAALALVIAAATLCSAALPEFLLRANGVVVDVIIPPLRSLHSGDVRDYVAFLALGVAIIGGAAAFACR